MPMVTQGSKKQKQKNLILRSRWKFSIALSCFFMLPFLTVSLRATSSIQVTHSAALKPHLVDNLVHQLLTQLSAAHGLVIPREPLPNSLVFISIKSLVSRILTIHIYAGILFLGDPNSHLLDSSHRILGVSGLVVYTFSSFSYKLPVKTSMLFQV